MTAYIKTIPTCSLGEAPHWNASKQELLFVDVIGQNVHRYVPGTGEHTKVHISQGETSFVVPVDGQPNKYMVGVGRSLEMMEWDGWSEEPTSLTNKFSIEPDQPQNSFKNGKCDDLGRLWAGTFSGAGRPVANLYRVTDSIKRVQAGVTTSNGIAWNSSNTLMYYIDSGTNKVDVFDFDNSQGTISKRRTVYDLTMYGEKGFAGGMTIDANNNLWVACWGGAQIIQVDSTTEQKIRTIDMPTKVITSLAFGGPNLDVLYLTSAAEKAEQASAGSLFQVSNVGAKGSSGGNNFGP